MEREKIKNKTMKVKVTLDLEELEKLKNKPKEGKQIL